MSTRFVANSTTEVSRMFLLFSGRYIFVFLMQRDANMISPYNCRALYTDSEYLSRKKPPRHEPWQECLQIHLLSSLMNWMVLALFFDGVSVKDSFSYFPSHRLAKWLRNRLSKRRKHNCKWAWKRPHYYRMTVRTQCRLLIISATK